MAEELENEGETYEGYPIIDTGVIITKTGDGLSEAMSVEPVYIAPNDKAQIVVGLRKTKDRYDFIRDKKSNKILGVKHIQVFEATVATFTNASSAKKELSTIAEKIKKARDEAKGQLTLVVGGDEDEVDPKKVSRRSHPDLAEAVDEATKDVE